MFDWAVIILCAILVLGAASILFLTVDEVKNHTGMFPPRKPPKW